MRVRRGTPVLIRIGLTAVVLLGLGMPSTASAIRKYICEHPTDGRCEATKDTGRIVCECGGESTELDVPAIEGASDQVLEDECWKAYVDVCHDDDGLTSSCEEPGRGSCDVTTAEGGRADCTCADGNVVNAFEEPALDTLAQDDLDEACYEQLADLCDLAAPSPTAQTMAPPGNGFGGPPASTGCHIGGAPAPVVGLLLLVVGAIAIPRRRRAVT
jgi:hypothetical protein